MERLEKLNMVGFVWSVENERWERKIAFLKKYREEHGHTHLVEDMFDEAART